MSAGTPLSLRSTHPLSPTSRADPEEMTSSVCDVRHRWGGSVTTRMLQTHTPNIPYPLRFLLALRRNTSETENSWLPRESPTALLSANRPTAGPLPRPVSFTTSPVGAKAIFPSATTDTYGYTQ